MCFPSAQIRRDGGFTLDGAVFPLYGIKAEVFLLLFNRRLGPFRDENIVKKQNPIRSFITGQGPMNRSCCIKKHSAVNVISRHFPWLWEIWVRDCN